MYKNKLFQNLEIKSKLHVKLRNKNYNLTFKI